MSSVTVPSYLTQEEQRTSERLHRFLYLSRGQNLEKMNISIKVCELVR